MDTPDYVMETATLNLEHLGKQKAIVFHATWELLAPAANQYVFSHLLRGALGTELGPAQAGYMAVRCTKTAFVSAESM